MMDTADKLRLSEGNRFILEVAFLQMAQIFDTEAPVVQPTRPQAQTVQVQAGNKSARLDAREVLWNRLLAGVKEKNIPTHVVSLGKLLGARDDVLYIGYKKATLPQRTHGRKGQPRVARKRVRGF